MLRLYLPLPVEPVALWQDQGKFYTSPTSESGKPPTDSIQLNESIHFFTRKVRQTNNERSSNHALPELIYGNDRSLDIIKINEAIIS